MIETLAQRVAPVPVIRADGCTHGIGFGLAYQSRSIGVHQVLQHTGS